MTRVDLTTEELHIILHEIPPPLPRCVERQDCPTCLRRQRLREKAKVALA